MKIWISTTALMKGKFHIVDLPDLPEQTDSVRLQNFLQQFKNSGFHMHGDQAILYHTVLSVKTVEKDNVITDV